MLYPPMARMASNADLSNSEYGGYMAISNKGGKLVLQASAENRGGV